MGLLVKLKKLEGTKHVHGSCECCNNDEHDELDAGVCALDAECDECEHSHENEQAHVQEHTGSDTAIIDSHSRNHNHSHDHSVTSGDDYHSFDRILIARLVFASIALAVALIINLPWYWGEILVLVSIISAGYDVILAALLNVLKKNLFDECFLMTVASIAAFCIGEYEEAAAVMILFQVGELFQDYAVGRTKNAINKLMHLRPDSVTVLESGEEKEVPAESVLIGSTIIIKPGERVALDCVVTKGSSALDTSALTGESVPRMVEENDKVLSGSVNISGALVAEVTAIASESTAARILELVQSESSKKSDPEKFITKFSKIYTPIIMAIALLTAIILPVFFKYPVSEGIYRALVLLVISCPCALVISVPLSYFAGIGGASKIGVLFKNSGAMDSVSKTKAVVFDKTGTLTKGSFKVTSVKAEKMEPETFLRIAAHSEAYSNHPIAKAIVEAYKGPIYIELIESFKEFPGKGVTVKVQGIPISIGTTDFLAEQGVTVADVGGETCVYMAVSNVYAGRITVSDTIKTDSAMAVRGLYSAGVSHVAMISGDSAEISEKIAKAVGISEFYAECLPADKVAKVHNIKSQLGSDASLIFVGDGLNDAPVITAADVGFAMGGLGSDAAVEAADVVIMDDNPLKVATAIHAARHTRRIIIQNIAFSLGAKGVILALGFLGYSSMWAAIFADVGVALLAVLNSMRAFYIKL